MFNPHTKYRLKGIRAKRSKWLDIRIREWNALDSVKVQPAHRKPGSMK